MGFARQEYWSGLPFPGTLPSPGIMPRCLVSPVLAVDSLPMHHLGSPPFPYGLFLKYWIEFPVLYSRSLLVIYFTYGCCLVAKLCLTLFDPTDCVACQAPLSRGFPRHEYWSGFPFPSSEIFPTQGSNPRLLHWRQILDRWATWEAHFMNNEWCVYVNPKLLISILLNLLRCLLAQMDVRRMCSLLLRGMFQTCPWRKSTDGLHVELYPPWLPDCLSISYQKRAAQVSEVNLRLPFPLTILPGSAHLGSLMLWGLGGREGSSKAETVEVMGKFHSLGRCSVPATSKSLS